MLSVHEFTRIKSTEAREDVKDNIVKRLTPWDMNTSVYV